MSENNWFSKARNDAVKKADEWRERFLAFLHRGIEAAPSGRWLCWRTFVGPNSCAFCVDTNGKIIDLLNYYETLPVYMGAPAEPPVHPNCRCVIMEMPAMRAGTVTINGMEGADWYLLTIGELPPYYLSKKKARTLGWKKEKGNLGNVAPGMMIGGDIFWNNNGKLPELLGRVWYEADINYMYGYRGDHRIVYSNDGLVFVTYGHYTSYYEIIY